MLYTFETLNKIKFIWNIGRYIYRLQLHDVTSVDIMKWLFPMYKNIWSLNGPKFSWIPLTIYTNASNLYKYVIFTIGVHLLYIYTTYTPDVQQKSLTRVVCMNILYTYIHNISETLWTTFFLISIFQKRF